MENKVYILGASGLIGSSLIKYFLGQNFQVYSPNKNELNLLHIDKEIDFKDSHVIYAAGIPRSKDNSDQAKRDNVEMIRRLVNFQKNIKSLTFLSSVEVYGDPKKEVINEETQINPLNTYAKGKIEAEQIIEKLSNNIPTHILRLPGVYGSKSTHGLIGIIKNSILNSSKVKILNNGNDLRDFIYVGDLGPIIESLFKLNSSTKLNVATGQSKSVKFICEEVKKYQRNFDYELSNENNNNFDLVFDNEKLLTITEDLALTSIEQGIKLTFN
jgi:nucleoside-diphosphate-sugar epimerase